MNKSIESFGRYPKTVHHQVDYLLWKDEIPDFSDTSKSYLPHGLGRSYGDSCLNPDNNLIITSYLNRFISFNENTGVLKAECGATLEQCLKFLLPRKWFLPVTPGTKYITLGGAVANDVHGKNHHKAGTFGSHVLSFDLLRSDGKIYHCSLTENTDLFKATIGGLGLTGIMLNIELRCVRCAGPVINCENIKFGSFEDFFLINEDSGEFDNTVAWINTNSNGEGIFSRGNFASSEKQDEFKGFKQQIPFIAEVDLINPLSTAIFNLLYYTKQFEKKTCSLVSFNEFFYPLDAVSDWNKVYGKKGFLQYQFVIPFEAGLKCLKEVFATITESGDSSFLTVLKMFGNKISPGMISFPRPGVTLAVDFKFRGEKTLKMLDRADKILINYGGRLYPAKDARMSAQNFRKFYPEWEKFSKFIDPKFSSGFWRRVTEN